MFKSASAWSMQYEITGLATGGVTAAFYVTPVNRQIGNAALGQVQLLENNPLTLFEGNVFQWKATSSSGNITADNRNANRISDRVTTSIGGFDLENTKVFNSTNHSEYWFLCDGKALILNYAADAWYLYTNMPFVQGRKTGLEIYEIYEKFFITARKLVRTGGIIVLYTHDKTYVDKLSYKEGFDILKKCQINVKEDTWLYVLEKV